MSHQNGPAAGNDTPGGPGQAAGGAGLAMLPAIWVGLNVALAGWGIMGSWRTTFDYEMPDGVLYLVYAGLVAGIVNILWGLYLIGLAVNRSDRFPRQFTVWQVANILWIVGREAYVLVTPDFVPTIQSLLFAAGQIAIGVVCILLLRRKSGTARAYSRSGSQRPPRHRLDHRRLPRRRRRRCARFRRRPARRRADRRGHRHELLRGRLRLSSPFSSACSPCWRARSPARSSRSGA